MKIFVVHIWLFLLVLYQRQNLASAQCSNSPVLCCLGLNNACNRGCYCDQACMTLGDCCSDYIQTCNQSNSQPPSPGNSPTPPSYLSSEPDLTTLEPSSTSELPVTPSSQTSTTSSTTSTASSTTSSSEPSSSSSPPTWTTPPSTTLSSSSSDTQSSETTEPSSSQTTTSPASPLSGQCSVPTVLCCPGHNNACYRGCYCDEICLKVGDCCPDYQPTCIQPNSESTSPSPTTWTTPPSTTLPSTLPVSSQTTEPTSSLSVCNTCTENEVCQERGGVYGCGCLEGQQQNPENFDAVESCVSSTGTISISRCQLFESGFYLENLHLNDPICKGTLENGRLLFYFDNEDHICGTTLLSNKTHFIYQNSIQSNLINTDQSIISREIWMNMTFSCAYPLIQTLSMPMGFVAEGGVLNEELPAGQGSYQIRMIPYHDAQFTSPYEGQVHLQVNQQMYVAVEVEGVDKHQIATVLDNCWATPVNDSTYHVRWNLITRECPNPDDPTVEVLQNGIDTASHFSFRMFTFSGISDHIFLHCQVHLCLVQNGRCASSCDHGYKRRRHRSLDFLHSTAISMGLKAQ